MLHLDYAELDVYEWGDDSDINGWQLNSTEIDLVRPFRNHFYTVSDQSLSHKTCCERKREPVS